MKRAYCLIATLAILVCQNAFAFYDPKSGKWLTVDPLGEAGGPNLTAFCANDPVNKVDPLGLLSEDESLAVLKNAKDKVLAASKKFGVPPRYIVATMYAELRYNASIVDQIQQSTLMKNTVMWKGGGSIGPAQMKPIVAIAIERALVTPSSPYYLGKKYENALPQTNPLGKEWKDIDSAAKDKLWARLTNPEEVSYVAAQLRMFTVYWANARTAQINFGIGVDLPTTIGDRLDILATLYNLGFPKVSPNGNPQSNEFGKHALEFYKNDKLIDIFPRGMPVFPTTPVTPATISK